MDVLGYVVVAALFVVVVIGFLLGVCQSRQRREAFRKWADRNNWTYSAKEPDLAEQWKEHPIRGAGSATTILRGTVPEGTVVSCTNDITMTGGTARPSQVTTLDVGVSLPTVVAAAPDVAMNKPLPPEPVTLDDPQFTWSLYCYSPEQAAAAARLFTTQVRQRIVQEDKTALRMRLTFEGQQIIVVTPGPQEIEALEARITLLRDLARMMAPELSSR